ncbi:MAG: glycosyltransferase family 2 protein [Paludibacteraceae bacterium]|nr:glycosyltransferase family 2 protein [Paludibacteraceae bacterium]
MKTAVVILNWNGKKFLSQFMPSVIANTSLIDNEIVVADNGSTDGSVDLLREQFPEVKVVLLDQNYGFAGGYNKALEQVEAENFLLLNSDVEVTPGWLDTLNAYMDANRQVAACQPKIRAYGNKEYFEHAGAAGGFIDKYGFPYCRGRVFSTVEKDESQYDEVTEIFWATGACMMMRSDIFRKMGGFDDQFFAHMEEIDLCWRINSRGYKIVCVPQSVVYHVGGGTLNAEHPRKTYLNFRNNLLMLYKNLAQSELQKVLNARFLFDYVAALQMLLTGKFKNAQAVLKARGDFRKMKADFEPKRRENLLYATCTGCSQVLKRSIVLEYYIRKKRFYSELK